MQSFLSLALIGTCTAFAAMASLCAVLVAAKAKGRLNDSTVDQYVNNWQSKILAPALVTGMAVGAGLTTLFGGHNNAAPQPAPVETPAAPVTNQSIPFPIPFPAPH